MDFISNKDLIDRFGMPAVATKLMVIWEVPEVIRVGPIPKKIYCHRMLVDPLTRAFRLIISRDIISTLKTWDGCYNDRPIRGREDEYKEMLAIDAYQAVERYKSVHAWACAIDVNRIGNGLGEVPTMDPALVKVFKDVGFDWGGDFHRLDGMHFQVSRTMLADFKS